MKVDANPYSFPLNGQLTAQNTALLVIDMQGDFCAEGGYMHQFGFDLTALRRPIPTIAKVLAACRASGMTVIHTRETFKPDLSDVQPHRRWRGIDGKGVAVGDEGPKGRYLIEGAECWQIIPELAPIEGETVFDKPSYGAFGFTAIEAHLRERGIGNLILTGLTTDCCIHTNVREALDRGFDCLTLSDATGACFEAVHQAAIELLIKKSGVFGAVGESASLLDALDRLRASTGDGT
ncbi:cysteine hydrolase family protein [Enterovirga rhinocerotis]|uniref:Nicotinamidase-related amidase n=1 Tax=Enterovirga rhinocerotis TaxID=1339210 RepID=A0A4R7BU24_9HYPH|nr:isochorismatase family cysteine hydrolase [Enterovirga rhinocerotis]TDR88883.1 nicotinamidase-related amidase [Enterovirga rhinocerotis]